MNASIVTETDPDDLKKKAGAALDRLILKRANKPMLFLLSGGSSFDLLDSVDDNSLSGDLTFGMLDDRYSLDPNINSFNKLTFEFIN